MKTATHVHNGQSTAFEFRAHMRGKAPVVLQAEDHLSAIALVYRRYAPQGRWSLYLVIDGTRVGEWALEPAQARLAPSVRRSTLSPHVHAHFGGM